MMRLPDVVVASPSELAAHLARRLELEADVAFNARGRFAIALPGGSVATAFFPRLAAARVDWGRADFFWVDERAVPPDHPDSNHGLAWSLWLGHADLDPARVHRMPADAPDLDAAALDHEAEMTAMLGIPPRLDVAILGVGPDGHVCSLFPGHAPLRERRAFVAAVVDSPKPPPRRLTLTLPALHAARLVVLAAFGSAKASVVRDVLANDASPLPAALALRGASSALVLVDPPAHGSG